jgi:peptidyl-tRNA hydrolase, PTH2 family
MVVVVRADLGLSPGKVAVQVAHAAVLLVQRAERRSPAVVAAWQAEGGRKIALGVPTLAELEAIDRDARAKGVPTAWVDDAGFTEVPPGTRTCLGLGPALERELDPITGKLPLL